APGKNGPTGAACVRPPLPAPSLSSLLTRLTPGRCARTVGAHRLRTSTLPSWPQPRRPAHRDRLSPYRHHGGSTATRRGGRSLREFPAGHDACEEEGLAQGGRGGGPDDGR